MKCSILNAGVTVLLNAEDDDYASLRERNGRRLTASALQRPEMNRAHLAALLRKALKRQQSAKRAKTNWRILLSGFTGNSANSNEHAS